MTQLGQLAIHEDTSQANDVADPRIEDYALIGDCKSAALVGRDGSIDWLCWPRFDSPACFAGLLGNSENGRWLIRPRQPVVETRRRYRPGTLVLDTEFRSSHGGAVVTDFMIPGDGAYLVRIVTGLRGRLEFHAELIMRFDYGATVPWVTRLDDGGLSAIAGPDRLVLWTKVALKGEDLKTIGTFSVEEGQSKTFILAYAHSFRNLPPAVDAFDALQRTEEFWRDWSERCPDVSPWTDAVKRSLITLKALTYAPTGGIVDAATTSLPECPCRNVLAGIHRRNSKLGLPLLLAPRCHVHTARANASRLLRGGPGLAELAAVRGRR